MSAPITFDVIIEQPFSDANTFVHDTVTDAIRLDGVMRVTDEAWANRGIIANAVTPRGEPLRAFLVSDLALPPTVQVDARAVGALEWTRGALTDRTIVAVPVADERYATVGAFNDLPAPHRAAIQRLLEDSARWLDKNSAEELVHLARQRARLAQSQRETEHARPAWEAASSRGLIDRLARETDLHTQAEAALFTLPYRFQQYIRLCLTPVERILYWVHRPRMTINQVMRIGGKTLREGLLLVTDQQMLWMTDAVTPTVAIERYGYIARSVALELISAVAVEEKTDCLILHLTNANVAGAQDTFAAEFPLKVDEELNQAAHLLESFVPRRDDCRLRRVVSFNPNPIPIDDPMESDHEKTRTKTAELQRVLAEKLNDEPIYAQALVPAWADGGAKLLTVTDRNVYLTLDHARSFIQKTSVYPLCNIVSNQICFSVMGSWLRLGLAQDKSFEIAFPPTALKWFNACWLTLRQQSSKVVPQEN